MKVEGRRQTENGEKRIFAPEVIIQRLDENPLISAIELVFYTADVLDIDERHGGDRQTVYSLNRDKTKKVVDSLTYLPFQRRAAGFRARVKLEDETYGYFPILDIDALVDLSIEERTEIVMEKLAELSIPGSLIFSGNGFLFLGKKPVSFSKVLEFQAKAMQVFIPDDLKDNRLSDFVQISQQLLKLTSSSPSLTYEDVREPLVEIGHLIIERFPLGEDLTPDSIYGRCLMDFGQTGFSFLDESIGVIRISPSEIKDCKEPPFVIAEIE